MSETTAEESVNEAVDAEAPSAFWPDDLVDMIAALAVVSALVLGVLWYVVNG